MDVTKRVMYMLNLILNLLAALKPLLTASNNNIKFDNHITSDIKESV